LQFRILASSTRSSAPTVLDQVMAPTSLTDLPPELLDHITAYLPTARSVSSLGTTSKSLRAFVDKSAWETFNRTRFPSLHPTAPSSQKDAARSLTTLSKAWDRRAFVARYIEPHGNIHAYPGAKKVERWKRPRGQTIGFTPQLDVYEEIGTTWRHRKETLAFSAGAEVCVRQQNRHGGKEDVRWMTYRPLSAFEGRDDITTLHLLKPEAGESDVETQRLITGTANGDLWILSMPEGASGDVPITYFVTNGQPVRSSSVLQQPFQQSLLVANMGDSRISVYPVDSNRAKIAPLSSIDIRPPQSNGTPAKHLRVWSTEFLSPHRIAAGIGPSSEPIHVYDLTPSGIAKEPIRKFSLQDISDRPASDVTVTDPTKKRSSSIYPIVPLPAFSTAGSSTDSNVFLSGAYDGVVRLHDLRSDKQVEQAYIDPTDDSSVYSLLPRGRESLLVGTSRHSLLKVFDMRLGAKCYSYLDATTQQAVSPQSGKSAKTKDWSLFLRPHNTASTSGRGGNNSWARSRSQASSVYSLASPSYHSPYIYAGVENAVLELAFTGVLDRHPDLTFFAPWQPPKKGGQVDPWRSREVLDLAMYDQTAHMKLCTQRSMWETWRSRQSPVAHTMEFPRLEGVDERWRLGSG